MKKKLIAGFVILLAAVFLVAMLVKLGEGEGDADLTQPSAEGTKPITEQGPVMENGAFTFTAAGFADRFSGTLPEGYTISTPAEKSAENNDKLLFRLHNSAGEDTGIALLLNALEPEETFGQLALVADAQCKGEDFAALLRWYVSGFMTGLTETEAEEVYNAFCQMYSQKKGEQKTFAHQEHTAVMLQSGELYYVLLTVHF